MLVKQTLGRECVYWKQIDFSSRKYDTSILMLAVIMDNWNTQMHAFLLCTEFVLPTKQMNTYLRTFLTNTISVENNVHVGRKKIIAAHFNAYYVCRSACGTPNWMSHFSVNSDHSIIT